MRKNYTRSRDLARSRRRQGRPDSNLIIATKMAKHDFHHAIKKVKKQHRTECLGEPKNTWRAARSLDPRKRSSFRRITSMRGREEEIIQDKAGMVKELLHSFFPEPPVPRRPEDIGDSVDGQLFSKDLTKEEIGTALSATSPDKAAGNDGLTIRAWREVWPVLQKPICTLFSTSLRQGKLPSQWRVANIVPLKKGNKDDYTIPKNHTPIPLLATQPEIMESVIAT